METRENELDALNKCVEYYLLEFVSVIDSGVYDNKDEYGQKDVIVLGRKDEISRYLH